MRGINLRSPDVVLGIVLLVMAGAGIALSLLGLGASMVTGFTSMSAVFVAVFGIVILPWLAARSVRGAVVCAALGLSLVVIAAGLLSTDPPSNSHFWAPINIGRYGGVFVGELGLALTAHAAVLGRIRAGRTLALVLINVVAVAIGAAIAGWETRS